MLIDCLELQTLQVLLPDGSVITIEAKSTSVEVSHWVPPPDETSYELLLNTFESPLRDSPQPNTD